MNTMEYRTRKWIRAKHLNPRETLFGGQVLSWIDEEAAIFASCQLKTPLIVTKYMSEINFVSPAYNGDVVEIGIDLVSIGNTSITLEAEVRNKDTKKTILKVDKIIFVRIDKHGKPKRHNIGGENEDVYEN